MVQRIIRGWIFPTVLSLIVTLGWIGQTVWAQRIVGNWFPVVTKMTVETVTPFSVDGVEGARLSGWATKLRDCTYQGIEFRLGSPYGVPIPARFLDRAADNKKGLLRWDGLLVGIEPNRINETYGEVIHECWGIRVRTAFFFAEVDQ